MLDPSVKLPTLYDILIAAIAERISHFGGNKTHASISLDISPRTIRKYVSEDSRLKEFQGYSKMNAQPCTQLPKHTIKVVLGKFKIRQLDTQRFQVSLIEPTAKLAEIATAFAALLACDGALAAAAAHCDMTETELSDLSWRVPELRSLVGDGAWRFIEALPDEGCVIEIGNGLQ